MCAQSKKSCDPEIKLQHKEALIKCAPLMVRQGSPESIEGLTTNGINILPFVLSLSKDLFSVSKTIFIQANLRRFFMCSLQTREFYIINAF